MSADPALALAPPQAAPAHQQGHRADLYLIAALAGVLLAHYSTLHAMTALWARSQTFAHGFLIPLISAWLVWRKRADLALVPRKPCWPAQLLLAAPGALWLISALANVQVLQQYSLVTMIAVTVAAVSGLRYAAAIGFPLAYLLLAVPFGEIFVPPLIEFTSSFAVSLLQLVGIPVYRENNFLMLPSGSWSVADACSGLRYLIASLALGTLYAYLNYRSLLRRLAFIAASLVLPVIANGLRASMIIMIGHWSNMRLAVGIDHLIYGWLFFGLVSALLFWFGSRWKEAHGGGSLVIARAGRLRGAESETNLLAAPAGHAGAAIWAVAITATWPLLSAWLLHEAPADTSAETALLLPAAPAPWHYSQLNATDWHVLHTGQPQRQSGNYSDGSRAVSLQLTWYRHQSGGAELLTPVRRPVVQGLPQWHEMSSADQRITVGARQFTVRQTVIQAEGIKLLAWRWYCVGGKDTSSPQLVKLLLARSKLLSEPDDGAEIAIAAQYDDQPEQAAAAMQDLLAAMLPAMDRSLRHAGAH